MKRCKRCFSIIDKKSSHCSSCGLEMNFKNTYYTNENKANYSGKNNKETNGKGIIIFFIIFYAIMFIIGVVTSVTEEESIDKNINPYFDNIDTSEIVNRLNDLKIIAVDYYTIWTYSLTNPVSTDIIASKTSLTYTDLNNSYCQNLSLNNTIENARNCVKTAYINNGTFSSVDNNLNYIYDLAIDNYGSLKYDILTDIYMHAITLISSINDENDYSNYEEVYNNTITSIETLLQELDLKTS